METDNAIILANEIIKAALEFVKKEEERVGECYNLVITNAGTENQSFYVERLKEANERLKEAYERLKEQQESHFRFLTLRAGQTSSPAKKQRLCNVPTINFSENSSYLTLPKDYVETAGVDGSGIVYFRQATKDQWLFLQEDVVRKNVKGYIIGPPGVGKSVCTLAFMASLNRNEWLVVWISLDEVSSCLTLNPNELTIAISLVDFLLPCFDKRRKFVCVDGYRPTELHQTFYSRLIGQLDVDNDRIVRCSSQSSIGKRNHVSDKLKKVITHYVYSWTIEEYMEAIKNQKFYESVKANLDVHALAAEGLWSINEQVKDEALPEEVSDGHMERVERALNLKFYYAGGSCRFMFQYPTKEVIKVLKKAIQCSGNMQAISQDSTGMFHSNTINHLFGMCIGDKQEIVSSYVGHLFSELCSPAMIADWGTRTLNFSRNHAFDGILFEWIFFASIRSNDLVVYDVDNTDETFVKTDILPFDPKLPFNTDQDGMLRVSQPKFWLRPVKWNQGGYDAIYIDTTVPKIIFVQVTRSDQHDLKLLYFGEILQKLDLTLDVRRTRSQSAATKAVDEIWDVKIYFLVKQCQLSKFCVGNIEGDICIKNYSRKTCAIRGKSFIY